MQNWKELSLTENGFYGYFKEGAKYSEKAMICMSGADGNKEFALGIGQEIRDMGYSVLVLGFWKWEGLPQEKCLVPVEYVENAMKWLFAWKDGKIKRVGIFGASMGAQYALLAASLLPELSCVIATAPFDYVLEYVDDRFKRTGKSIYTWKGKEVTYSPSVLLDEGVPGLLWKCATDKHYGLKRMLRFYYDKSTFEEASRIRVEHMKADVLLLASENDDCWPAEVAARHVEKILKEKKYPYRAKAVIYEKGSHAIGGVSIMQNKKIKKMMAAMLPAEKKYPKECDEARADSVKQIAAFLEQWN